jgi:hypothetical protein
MSGFSILFALLEFHYIMGNRGKRAKESAWLASLPETRKRGDPSSQLTQDLVRSYYAIKGVEIPKQDPSIGKRHMENVVKGQYKKELKEKEKTAHLLRKMPLSSLSSDVWVRWVHESRFRVLARP